MSDNLMTWWRILAELERTVNHNMLCSADEDKANRVMLSESALKTKDLGG